MGASVIMLVSTGATGLAAVTAVLDPVLFFFFTVVTGPRRSLSLELSDTRVYEP